MSVDQVSSITHLFHLAPHGTRASMSVDQVSSTTHLFHLAPHGTRAFIIMSVDQVSSITHLFPSSTTWYACLYAC